MAEELRIGSVTQDFALRVVAPGALTFFLLAVFFPRILVSVSQSTVAGAFGFLVLGTVSYVLYRGLYVGVLSRSSLMSPQLALAGGLVEQVMERREPWTLVRAVYIEWREIRATNDPRMKYVVRLAPYVHSGYQSGLIFLGFGISVALVSHDLLIGLGLAVLGGGVFARTSAGMAPPSAERGRKFRRKNRKRFSRSGSLSGIALDDRPCQEACASEYFESPISRYVS